MLSCIPMSLSICLKEHVLSHPTHPVDMHLVNAFVAGFQLVLGESSSVSFGAGPVAGLMLCPISYMVTANQLSLDGLGVNMYDGLKCAMSGPSLT